MLAFLSNPAFWASLSGLLAAIGIEIPGRLFEDAVAAAAAIAGIIGILESLWHAGHRVRYIKPGGEVQ